MSIVSKADWIRWGFTNLDRLEDAAQVLESRKPGLTAAVALICSRAADPDQAFLGFSDLAQVWDCTQFDPDHPGWVRLITLVGGSPILGRWLVRRPADCEVFFESDQAWSHEAIRTDICARIQSGALPGEELKWAYRRHLMRIAARDLTSENPGAILEEICQELSDLADGVVDAALSIAKTHIDDHHLVRLGVVGLGKTGACEANYLSDVDVIFVAAPQDIDGTPACSPEQAIRIATSLARTTMNICSGYSAAGTIWEMDANLRPEGAAGPLVRSLEGMRSYYTTWAKNWEFQAMLKARAMAGDTDLGQEFVDMVSALVWTAGEREGFVNQAQEMRARVVSMIPANEVNREIKLGPGGLRDTEFSVQILQLVHGRADERLRAASTLSCLDALVRYGYVGRADGAELDQAYRFQRLLEHRLQLFAMKRTHMMPEDTAGLRTLARAVGILDGAQVAKAWHDSAITVRKLHERIYYSPLLETVARIPTDEIHLSADAAATRLKALGYADPRAALRHIEALTQGMSRRAEITRQILPAFLGWLAAGPNPDAGLLAFRQMAQTLGSTPFFLRGVRDEGQMAQNLAKVLASSRYAAAILQHSPASVQTLLEPTQIPSADALATEFTQVVHRYGGDPRTYEVIRATRRRELLRIATADLLGDLDVIAVGQQLCILTAATIEAGLTAARLLVPHPPDMAIIAMGTWGGCEMAYSSDADIQVVLADSQNPDDVRAAADILSRLRSMLKVGGLDPDLLIDVNLRPEGKDGPIVRTISSAKAYYQRWAQPWEAQALLRACHGAGSASLSQEFLADIDSLRYHESGLDPNQLAQIRRSKARIEHERIGKGLDPRNHVKLGPGGLSDIEFSVQCLQMHYGFRYPQLRTASTLEALQGCVDTELITQADGMQLQEAFVLAWRIRNAITLVRNKASDVLPPADMGHLARVLGFTGGSHLGDEWHRVARRARTITDSILWSEDLYRS